jgi:hypothetical protein
MNRARSTATSARPVSSPDENSSPIPAPTLFDLELRMK